MNKYEIKIIPEADGTWTVSFPEIKGCIGSGETPEEALKEANENLEFHLESLEKANMPIPEPYKGEEEYSGKVVLRLPKSMHKKAVEYARNDGVSLNSLLSAAVANYVGIKEYEYKSSKVIDFIPPTKLKQN